MKPRVAITHRIEQGFGRRTALPTHWLRLRPAPHTRAKVTAYSLRVGAKPHFLNWVRDPFENYLARLDFPEPAAALDIDLELIAEFEPVNPFDFIVEPDAATHPFSYSPQLLKELEPYLAVGEPGPRLTQWLASLEREPLPTVERLTSLNQRVHEHITLADGGEAGGSDLEALLARGSGSPLDLAWLLTTSLRHLGLAGRVACGYRVLLSEDPEIPDAVSLHAWSETFLPGAGWVGFDPSAGLLTAETYIPFACAPDPERVRPVVPPRTPDQPPRTETVRVRRLIPEQVHPPFTETEWADIVAVGSHVERDLTEQGLNPTLGVSLTFVAQDPASGPEWTLAALGPSKRWAAETLLRGLHARLAPRGVPQLAQGEWYSGDPAPRWQLGCFYRADGQPIVRNPERLDWGDAPSPVDAETFARSLARALGLSPDSVLPAYEDPLHARWRARWGPTPPDADLSDPTRRRALAERLSVPQGPPTGYVLPLRWDHGRDRWSSGAWPFRRKTLFLMPGTFPLGYRLPLDSVKKDEESQLEALIEQSPFEQSGLLPQFYGEVSARLSTIGPASPEVPLADPDKNGKRTPRTAVGVEVRDGHLHVFLPPVSHLEHYLQLVAAVEAAAEATGSRFILEGYAPPDDHRLRRLVLDPDAGTLRLTLPETDRWQEQLDLIHAAYEEGRRVGLLCQRRLPDGSTGSAGTGRLSLGGEEPARSPFLRRPEVLRGLITYFQRHPSLSYFFAGRLIGPSGAAPRPDEGRDEALYELSIALEYLPKGETGALWQSDRILRHLLADPSGDLKRAEIRIDHLYAPERSSLRQGRVYVNAFDTAPEARIAALQSLLILSLLGRFGRHPDSGKLTRWGGALHDRFMLPHVLWEDLRNVIRDLNDVGYPLQLEWFEPIKHLRFPILGQVQIGGITLELQTALEPWPLLAEEVANWGVTRFIDAANERIQVRLDGLSPGRYVLACNGCGVPIQLGSVHGEYVAGVRYKIANPPATLHPTIPPISALVFDLIDTWTGRAIGGCTYLPPQPQLWGPMGSPIVPPEPPPAGDKAAAPRVAPLPWTSLAPLGRSGGFLPRGSGVGPMAIPPRYSDERWPYLLDLTQC